LKVKEKRWETLCGQLPYSINQQEAKLKPTDPSPQPYIRLRDGHFKVALKPFELGINFSMAQGYFSISHKRRTTPSRLSRRPFIPVEIKHNRAVLRPSQRGSKPIIPKVDVARTPIVVEHRSTERGRRESIVTEEISSLQVMLAY